MAIQRLTFEVRLAWWVRLYLAGVVLFARTFGLCPDPAKVAAAIQKGIRTRIKSQRVLPQNP